MRQKGQGSCLMAAVRREKHRCFYCVATGLPHVAQCSCCMMAMLQRGAPPPRCRVWAAVEQACNGHWLAFALDMSLSLTRMTDPNSCPTTMTQNGWLSRPKTA